MSTSQKHQSSIDIAITRLGAANHESPLLPYWVQRLQRHLRVHFVRLRISLQEIVTPTQHPGIVLVQTNGRI
jgi:hypothetical protein